jgi:hypothetical protein
MERRTLGMQNVFDEDPHFVAGSFENGYAAKEKVLRTHVACDAADCETVVPQRSRSVGKDL